MEVRVIGRHKQSSAAVIAGIQDELDVLFSGAATTRVDTFGSSIHQVVKHVSRVILLDDYRPANLNALLGAIALVC